MNPIDRKETATVGSWRRPIAWLLQGLAALVALAGSLAALGAWGFMSFYADDKPNSWLQNLSPLLIYMGPGWACAAGLFLIARRVRHPAR